MNQNKNFGVSFWFGFMNFIHEDESTQILLNLGPDGGQSKGLLFFHLRVWFGFGFGFGFGLIR